jgi:hypothetical protein
MSTERDSLSRFLERLKATSRSKNLDEYSERLLWTTRCRQLLQELQTEAFDVSEELQVPVGVPSREEGVPAILRPDFVVTKDEVRLLVFIDIASSVEEADSSTLRQYKKTLTNTSLASGVIHCWRGENIPSVALDIYKVSKLDLSEKSVHLGPVLPVKECIRAFYAQSFVGNWGVEGLEALKAEKSVIDTLSLVKVALQRELKILKSRPLKRWDRREAQALIDNNVLDRVVELLRRSISSGRRENIGKAIQRTLEEK